MSQKNLPDIPSHWAFPISAAAGLSGWMFVHPFDVIKVQLQITEGSKKLSPIAAIKNTYAIGGVPALYSGISAAVTRQLTYTSMRLTFYDKLSSAVKMKQENAPMSFLQRLGCGLVAGCTSAFLVCPVEVSLVRMQADSMLADHSKRRNYKHIGDALTRIISEEGLIGGGYKGVGPTVARGAIVSMTQLGTYDQSKHSINNKFGLEGMRLAICASLCSAVVYSYASLPMDIAKSRMQNQKRGADGLLPYTSIMQTLFKIVKNEGATSLWKGMSPYFCRSGGHTVFMMLFLEQYKNAYYKLNGYM